jgi:hypothetical protein
LNLVGPVAARDSTFRVRLGSAVWSVTKNDVFYGDYLTRAQAVAGACAAACVVDALGGLARVLAEPGSKLIAHNRLAPTS